ncbi:hypothetical protein GOP47_0027562 [Adiantum capillus-veneris]|nr:hypothetical protein GOP47_0027562 [Adiantum capillus-veneris]
MGEGSKSRVAPTLVEEFHAQCCTQAPFDAEKTKRSWGRESSKGSPLSLSFTSRLDLGKIAFFQKRGGLMATSLGRQQLSEVETTCGLLLNELQLIWDEVGEGDEERDQMLLELEQECLEVYRRKVDWANCARASLHQLLADMHSEIVALATALGERPPMTQLEKRGNSLKEQLAQLKPILEDMTKKRDDRARLFEDIRTQIQRIQHEITPSLQTTDASAYEQDLTQRKLEELQAQLQMLQKEKDDRSYKVVEYVDIVHDLCAVLGCDFYATIREVHPTLDDSTGSQTKSISNETINTLDSTIQSLREEKRRRMQKIQDLGASLLELWNLMDTPVEEQQEFHHVTCNIAAAEHEVFTAGALSLRILELAEREVERLENLKASKMKELVLKKQTELEEICRKAHIIPEGHVTLDSTIASMESGMVDPGELLASIEGQIVNVKEEAFSRKDIMDKIEKWMAACEEESWLEEYNKDENRYNATRGAHLNLKRAERARATVNKITTLVESLIIKTTAWENERGKPFLYDGVRFLSTLEEYNILRIEKEEERRRQRDQKRLHEQLVNEQETLFGTKPSPNGRTPLKKGVANNSRLNGGSTPASRRISLGGAMLHQELSVTARLNCITPARNEQRVLSGVLPQESPAMGRVSGITPGKSVFTPASATTNKDMRIRVTHTPALVNRVLLPPEEDKDTKNKGTQTPSSVNRVLLPPEEDILPSQGALNVKRTSTVAAVMLQDVEAQSTMQRVPLSPVSALGMRPNTNIEGHATSTTPGIKSTSILSKSSLEATTPLSSRPANTVVDEENTTPPRGTPLQQQPQPQLFPAYQQSPLQFVPAYPKPQEYSFEERRLALVYHHPQSHYSASQIDEALKACFTEPVVERGHGEHKRTDWEWALPAKSQSRSQTLERR